MSAPYLSFASDPSLGLYSINGISIIIDLNQQCEVCATGLIDENERMVKIEDDIFHLIHLTTKVCPKCHIPE